MHYNIQAMSYRIPYRAGDGERRYRSTDGKVRDSYFKLEAIRRTNNGRVIVNDITGQSEQDSGAMSSGANPVGSGGEPQRERNSQAGRV